MIQIKNLHKAFGSLKVLSGITTEFKKGETTVILGKSGTGKSVLIKHIVKLLEPDSGMILFEGKDIGNLKDDTLNEYRKQIGFLFQSAALYDSMSVFENVAFPLRRHTKHTDTEILNLVKEALNWVSLEGSINKMPSELSGGMKKRVGLARSLILKPKVMLYDEPTTGLDPITSTEIAELILKLQHQFGTTGLVVTHDIPCAFRVADRAIMLFEGNILFDDKIEAIAESKNEFVQKFYQTSVAQKGTES